MSKIDLRSVSGLPIVFVNDELIFKDADCKEKAVVGIDDIREQLLNKELDCPGIFYTKYKEVDTKDSLFKSKKVKVNIYTMHANLAGIEFVKTRATRCRKYPRIIEILHGSSTILMQKYRSPKDNRIIKLQAKKSQKIIIPAEYDFVIVNTRQSTPLIFLEVMNSKAIVRRVLDENSGMAYYVIRKNAKQEIVRNPNYKIVNEPEKVDTEKVVSSCGITPKTTITKQIIRKNERFDWLSKEDSVTY
jgi:oxalate decarboxylase/phosphoglucose isomerase-like protein (cupin superfamily)